jgi:two-component system invasion response regulator UvrY
MSRLLLVDDHDLVRSGVRRLLEDHAEAAGISAIAEAASGEEGVDKAREWRPDLVIMDLSMPGMGGLEALRRMRRHDRGLKVIVLTVHSELPYPRRVFDAGARGYLTKGCDLEEMLTAVRTVLAGGHYVSPEVAQTLALAQLAHGDDSPFARLSDRELQVVMLLSEGHGTQAISERLCLSPKTVSTYKTRLQDKLGVGSDLEVVRAAMRHGLVRPDPEG